MTYLVLNNFSIITVLNLAPHLLRELNTRYGFAYQLLVARRIGWYTPCLNPDSEIPYKVAGAGCRDGELRCCSMRARCGLAMKYAPH